MAPDQGARPMDEVGSELSGADTDLDADSVLPT
jgi:hypothetical protein